MESFVAAMVPYILIVFNEIRLPLIDVMHHAMNHNKLIIECNQLAMYMYAPWSLQILYALRPSVALLLYLCTAASGD